MGRQYSSESYQNSPGRAVVRESYGDRAIGGRVPMGREGTDGSPTNCGNYQNHVDETIANNDRGLPDAAEFAALISGRRDRRSRERRDRRHYKYSPTRLPLLHLKSYLQKMVDRLALVLKMRESCDAKCDSDLCCVWNGSSCYDPEASTPEPTPSPKTSCCTIAPEWGVKETCPVDYPTNLGTVNGNGLCCSNGDIGSFNTAALQACPSPEPTPSPTTTDQAAAAAYKKQVCAPVENAISKGVGCLSVGDDESTCNSCG